MPKLYGVWAAYRIWRQHNRNFCVFSQTFSDWPARCDRSFPCSQDLSASRGSPLRHRCRHRSWYICPCGNRSNRADFYSHISWPSACRAFWLYKCHIRQPHRRSVQCGAARAASPDHPLYLQDIWEKYKRFINVKIFLNKIEKFLNNFCWAVTVFSGRAKKKKLILKYICIYWYLYLFIDIFIQFGLCLGLPYAYLQKTTAKKSLVAIYSISWSRFISSMLWSAFCSNIQLNTSSLLSKLPAWQTNC